MYKSIRVGSGRGHAVAVGIVAGRKSLPRGLDGLTPATRRKLGEALDTPGFTAGPGEVAFAGSSALLFGLGPVDDLNPAALRLVGARLVRALDRAGVKGVSLRLADSIPPDATGTRTAGRCLAEGIGLANWRVDFFAGEASRTDPPRPALTLSTTDAGLRPGLQHGLAMAESTNYARRLAATPPNIAHPGWLATECRRLAREVGLRCRVITYAQAREQGLGGLVNVGRASSRKPCLIILEHRPPRVAAAARSRRLVLVGKTVTYDTGGYSLKINNAMKGMKYDKNGGMAVIGAMRAIAALKLPVRVWGLLPAAENMISGDAYRPDDIITMYNGVSVEVTNTDAEGRLVLADALAYACRKIKPTAIVDAATLTGGVVVALGSWCAGLWCNDGSLQERLEAAAETAGERVWPMPLWTEHRDFMRARHADIWNSGPKRDGHPIQGAAFLSFFVDEDVPWAHLDIAGVSAVDADQDLYVQGPTGYGVRLLTDLAEGYAK